MNAPPPTPGAMVPPKPVQLYPQYLVPAQPPRARGRPRRQRNRAQTPRREQEPQLHVQRHEGFSIFCLIQCIPFALGWTVVFVDLCLMIGLNFNAMEKITVGFHEDWSWEAFGLGMQAAFALFIMCAAGGVIASRSTVRPLYYAWICISLCALTGANIGWMIHEFNHGHTPIYHFWKVSEVKGLAADLKGYFGRGGSANKVVPQWMENMQHNVGCCGIESYEDWFDRFGFLSLPDSCCVDKMEGCGDDFFSKREKDRPMVFQIGCGVGPPETSGMTYKIFHLLLLVKTIETFLFAVNLVIWLFCLRREYPPQVRVRNEIQDVSQPQPSAPSTIPPGDQKQFYTTGYAVIDDYGTIRPQVDSATPQHPMIYRDDVHPWTQMEIGFHQLV